MNDPYNLQRFVDAQKSVYKQVCLELGAGRKSSHWMWYVFPQIRGLGHSETAQRYAIASRKEAEAYLMHPLLGTRLRQCTQLVNDVQGRSARQIFDFPDDMKFQSCMTLFAEVTSDNEIFKTALQKYFGGNTDSITREVLRMKRKFADSYSNCFT